MASTRPTPRHHRGILLLAIAVIASGCRSVSVRGVIQTTREQPIAQATLALRPGNTSENAVTGSSDSNGCFNLYQTIPGHHGEYVLIVDLPGYKPLRVSVAAGPDNLLLVTMEAASAAGSSTVRPISSAERYLRYATPCEPLVNASSISRH